MVPSWQLLITEKNNEQIERERESVCIVVWVCKREREQWIDEREGKIVARNFVFVTK